MRFGDDDIAVRALSPAYRRHCRVERDRVEQDRLVVDQYSVTVSLEAKPRKRCGRSNRHHCMHIVFSESARPELRGSEQNDTFPAI
jgi:hypothetical protein